MAFALLRTRSPDSPRRPPAAAAGRLVRARRALAVLAVVAATVTGAGAALSLVDLERRLSAGTIRVGVSPGHPGSLDLYVPLVDWGARFEGVRFPARLRVDLRAIDRRTVARVARGREIDVAAVRAEARDAIASYLRILLAIVFVSGLALGTLVAVAVRGGPAPPRLTLPVAVVTAVAAVVVLVVTLPPRGEISDPEYYAHGPDLPRALSALRTVTASAERLDEELNAQLVGLARLVEAPAGRPPLAEFPRMVLASDLHNNVLSLPALERSARNAPILFAGDLTDSGSPLETALVRRVADAGNPLVFVSGNHDSDVLERRLAEEGAIVLTERGRLLRGGRYGRVVVRVGGLRVAGYRDPFRRRAADAFEDRFEPEQLDREQERFRAWLEPLLGRVDIVMVHEPALAALAVETLRDVAPPEPLVIVQAHTHATALATGTNLAVINPGSLGAGGTGNLGERTPLSLAVLTYRRRPTFTPLAADLVSIDPGSGSATARRERLDEATT